VSLRDDQVWKPTLSSGCGAAGGCGQGVSS
jgi:hypothetical protein